MAAPSVLLIGFGNPGCQDDGLGPAFAEAIAALGCDGVTVDADYQLVIEDAHEMAQHDVVVFADADAAGTAPFALTPVPARASIGFSSHSVRPEELVWMAEQLFARTVEAYLLSIRGRSFEQLTEGLTPEARGTSRRRFGSSSRCSAPAPSGWRAGRTAPATASVQLRGVR